MDAAESVDHEDNKLCPTCSDLQIDRCFVEAHDRIAQGPQRSPREPVTLRKWKAVSVTTPDCALCQLVHRAAFHGFVDKTVDAMHHQTLIPKRDSLLKTTKVLAVRLTSLRDVTDDSIRNLRNEQTDDLIVVEINLCRLERIIDSSPGSIFPEKFQNCLIPERDEFRGLQRIDPRQANLRMARKWYDYCIRNHVGTAGCEKRGGDLGVRNFKVIDCHERRIVLHSGEPYLALSYVWGPQVVSAQDAYRTGSFLQTMPRTIEDAISVTKELNFRYLWTDRYCIDQSDIKEANEQIARMDVIYEHADMTIIAAAGKDASHGLPGIRSQYRPSQITGTICGMSFTALQPSPVDLIRQSKWMHRGWTYQEALLSRRRLIFTEAELYFECWGMACRECIDIPLEQVRAGNTSLQHRIGKSKAKALFPYNSDSGTAELVDRIKEYRQRQFSFESDILDGFTGALRAFHVQFGINHCWGVPIVPDGRAQPKAFGATVIEFGAVVRDSLPECLRQPRSIRGGVPSSPAGRGLDGTQTIAAWHGVA